ncbi:MAG: SWIM zinc finger family protein [Ruminococcus sp.]|nr:SWIM zinc finger family protein [Ruminococcus sp.]
MQKASTITEELIRSAAPNAAALSNAKKISDKDGFQKLCISDDETLIFGECKGSGKNPYYTSADFIGEAPVYRCSCPSRQFPCKHALAIMYDYLAGKTFEKAEVPEDIERKRGKIAQKAEKAACTNSDCANAAAPKPAPKKNTAAAAKKLQKQREGLDLAESFVNDILSHGASAVSKAAAEQYMQLAKQLGDYYLPEPQQLIYEIVGAAEKYGGGGGMNGVHANDVHANDESALRELIHKCVRLSSSVKKCREYIDRKLENGEVLPEDSVLYEAMGGVWKLTQLKEIGLFKENARLTQLSFTVIDDKVRKLLTDVGYWADLDSGEIFTTENIRPYKAMKHIKEEDSAFGVYSIETLYLYPGTMNRRVRWESFTAAPSTADTYKTIISKAEPSFADAVKKAKNELKNTLAAPYAVLLLPFDRIEYTTDGAAVLIHGEERVRLSAHPHYPDTAGTLKLIAGGLTDGAMLCALFYDGTAHEIKAAAISAVTENGIARL